MKSNLRPNQRWISGANADSVAIQEYGVCRPFSVGSTTPYSINVKRPDADTLEGPIFINDQRNAASGEPMVITCDFPTWVAFNGSVPSVGDRLHAVDGADYMEPGGGPFIVVAVNPNGSSTPVFVDRIDPGATWAVITGRSGTAYSGTEVVPGSGGTFSVKSGGISFSGNLYEINQASANFNVQGTLIVRVWPGASGTYLFDRGLTGTETIGSEYTLITGGTFLTHAPSGSTVGLKIVDLIDDEGDTVTIQYDSHGQVKKATKVAVSPDPGCTGGPFSGTIDRVTAVTINDMSINTSTCEINIDYTVTTVTDCYKNGLLMSSS